MPIASFSNYLQKEIEREGEDIHSTACSKDPNDLSIILCSEGNLFLGFDFKTDIMKENKFHNPSSSPLITTSVIDACELSSMSALH